MNGVDRVKYYTHGLRKKGGLLFFVLTSFAFLFLSDCSSKIEAITKIGTSDSSDCIDSSSDCTSRNIYDNVPTTVIVSSTPSAPTNGTPMPVTIVAETDSPFKTAASPQRKTFSSQGVDWAFWFGGQVVHYGKSADHGATWTELGTLPIDTWRYSVAERNGTAFIAYESANDIYIRRATLTSSSATWGAAILALDAGGASDNYSRPSVAIGNDGAIYIAAYRLNNGTITAHATQSTSTYDATLGFAAPVAVGMVGNSSLGELALIPAGVAAIMWEGFLPQPAVQPPVASPSGMALPGLLWEVGLLVVV